MHACEVMHACTLFMCLLMTVCVCVCAHISKSLILFDMILYYVLCLCVCVCVFSFWVEVSSFLFVCMFFVFCLFVLAPANMTGKLPAEGVTAHFLSKYWFVDWQCGLRCCKLCVLLCSVGDEQYSPLLSTFGLIADGDEDLLTADYNVLAVASLAWHLQGW